MNNQGALQTTFWTMILIQTVGSVDMPGRGARKMPSPHQYVAIVVLWAILGLIADTGPNGARVASRFSILLVIAASVIGPFGYRAVAFLRGVASQFSIAAPTISTPTTTNPAAGPGHRG